MQRAEARFAITLAPRVTDDRALDGLSYFDFQPGFASLAREIRAAALFGHDAFKPHLFHGIEEGRSVFDHFTHAICGAFFNRILEPLAAPCQRLIDDRPSIQIKAVEDIADGWMFDLRALDPAFGLLLHAMDDVSEVRFAIGFKADNFSVKQS